MLHREGLLPQALELAETINSRRATPMTPFEKVGLTERVRSNWLRRSFRPAAHACCMSALYRCPPPGKETIRMFSHITIGTNDFPRAAAFYDAVLAPLGIMRFWAAEDGSVAGWRRDEVSGSLYVGAPFNKADANPGNGCMCAFKATSRESVRLAYEAALANGGTDEGLPGPRPQYKPMYYGAYFRDPDGNKLHVVHLGPA